MVKKKIIIRVTETVHHMVKLELPEDEMNSLVEELDGLHGDDVAGDMCSRITLEDGEWELEDYEVSP